MDPLDLCIPILARLVEPTPPVPPRARHYSREQLPLTPDVAGAAKWGVALASTMLTYFEIEPHSRFEAHRHAGEQITLVLCGELVFEVDGKAITVREGDVIAIPRGVPHAVHAGRHRVRAIDAWSPPIEGHLTAAQPSGIASPCCEQ
jgi:quercetin dioxygenase-like cupin family protein